MKENFDGIGEQHNKPPLGISLFFIGAILWGLYYIAFYTPSISGWSQKSAYEEMAAQDTAVPKPVQKENPYTEDPRAIEEGKSIYSANCASCHGENLKGGVGPDLTAGLQYGEAGDKMFESIAQGRPNGMPPYDQQLGSDKIWKVQSYINSVRAK